jgi:error-prone DNA polymerase
MYVELHAASAFSFLQAASLPEDLATSAARMDMPGLAIVDRDGVYGAPRFHLAARQAGVRPHIGVELTLKGGHRCPLLVATRQGYRNLCRLITRMKMRERKGEGEASLDELAEHAAGLICLTGGERGPLASTLRNGGPQVSRACLYQLQEIFGPDNVYVEVQRHFNREEEARIEASVILARQMRMPLVATNGVRHTDHREILDVFTAIRHHRTLETAGRLLSRNAERRLKSPREMARLFSDLPEAIANTLEISSRLEFTMNDLGYRFPPYPVPGDESMDSYLRQRTLEGARDRYRPFHEKARLQIERELELIKKLELAGYFLIVWDIVQFCRRESIMVQGRGSAANSAVCYALGITAVDPVGMELLFERFLSEERGEWPDIDLDLPSGDQRERAIQYVYAHYDRHGAAMTANVITYRGRSAAREVGKALGFDAETLDRISKLVSRWEYQDPNDTLDRQFHDAGLDTAHPRIRKFIELSVGLQKLPRHLGQHSGGLVICQGSLDSVVPLEPASMPNRTVVQWDKDDCAAMGIIKVDLLGLGMMAVLEDTIEIIARDYGENVDLARLPADDPQVFETLQKADTVGMFQIESRAQMSCLPRLKPTRFYDLVVQVAIIRPGPIVGKMVHPYLNRRQGREPVTYPHPSLEPALRRTLGVPLFQEQLLRVAMIAAGFSGGQAEELRRAFGFKRSEERMGDIEVELREGMNQRGITGEAQQQIVGSITSFALYGFPESHAASFALIAYASAYLKCHYLCAFTAAILNNQPMGFYSPATLVKDAQRHGLRILPIDVTSSAWRCSLERHPPRTRPSGKTNEDGEEEKEETKEKDDFALRLGLNYVKGLREIAGLRIVRERRKRRFESVDDLARRVPELQKNELTLLAEVGALNFIDREKRLNRRDALWQVERASRRAGPLWDPIHEPDHASPLRPMSAEERLTADFRVSGLTMGPHPMALGRRRLHQMGVRRAVDLAGVDDGTWVKTAGCVIARQRPATAGGFVFLSIEDETGIANAIFAPDMLEKNRAVITTERFILIEGRLQHQDNVISVKARKVRALDITAAETRSRDFY